MASNARFICNMRILVLTSSSSSVISQTLLDIQANLKAMGIPAQYFQLDSWWYYKGINDGVTLWEPMPSVFPDGLKQFLSNDLPVALHNRYFAPDNQYRGKYNMICEDWGCLPLDQSLFEYMMSRVKPWGTFLYEQDWLITTYMSLNCTRNNVSNAMDFLQAMGNAATNQGFLFLCSGSIVRVLDLNLQLFPPFPSTTPPFIKRFDHRHDNPVLHATSKLLACLCDCAGCHPSSCIG